MGNVVKLFKEAPAKPAKTTAAKAGAIESANFTDAQVKAWLRRPPAKRVEYKDASDPKLRARVSKGLVALSLYAWCSASKKPKRWSLGNVTSIEAPEYNVTQIRKAARELVVKLDKGIDIAVDALVVDYDQMRTDAASSTIGALLTEYLDNKKIAGRSMAADTRKLYFRTLISTLGPAYNDKLSKLTPPRLLAIVQERSATSMHAATQTVAILSAICNRHKLPDVCALVKDRGGLKPRGPGRPSKLGVATAQDVAAWAWNGAHDDPASVAGTVAAMTCVGLVMGWRRSTIRQMHWDWIDFEARTIAIPWWATKGKRDELLPLPPRLLALLKHRRAHIDTDLCFPTLRDRRKPADFETSALNKFPVRMSPHDMRKAFSLALRKVKAPDHATKILMMHSTKADVGLHNYLMTVDPDELIELIRESCDAVEALILQKVGDKAARKRLDAAAYDRAVSARSRARQIEKTYRDSLHLRK